MLSGERILAGIESAENGVGGAKLLAEIHAGRIEFAGVGAFIQGDGVFGGGEAVLLRSLGEARAQLLHAIGERVDMQWHALDEGSARGGRRLAIRGQTDLDGVIAGGRFGQSGAHRKGTGGGIHRGRGRPAASARRHLSSTGIRTSEALSFVPAAPGVA